MAFRNPREAMMFGSERIATAEEERFPLCNEERELLQKARKKSREIERPTISDFVGKVNESERRIDSEWLQRQQSRQEEQAKTGRAEILESIIKDSIELSDWMGGNCYTAETSEYDDRANHTDFVIEWEGEDGEITRLAVDITSAEDDEVIRKKEGYIKRELQRGHMTKLKYFRSEAAPDFEGTITGIPRIVLAIEKEGVQDLSKDIVNKNPREIAKNPEQLLLLEQVRRQMLDQVEYSLSLVLEKISNNMSSLDQEEQDELKALAQSAINLEQSPDTISDVLAVMDEKEKLTIKLGFDREIKKYLEAIKKQRQILEITNGLIEEKKACLEKSS